MVQAPVRWATYRVPDTLPDDTEESIVGTEWHQEAISALAGMLGEARRRAGAAWAPCNQIALTGLRRADGRAYDPKPDVMVLSHPLPSGALSSVALADVGAPLFIAEVASRSTVGADVGEKQQVYEAIGVQEYVVFDPDGALLSTPLLAWRLVEDAYVPWHAEATGLWHSTVLDVTLIPTQPIMGVRDRTGRGIDPPQRAWERVDELEQRVRELEEDVRRLRGEPPT
jgi:Uma2 family endonuclease